MSGPKCGQAQLNREREAQLRRQREREERVRRAQGAQRRDEQRQQRARQSESRVSAMIGQVEAVLAVAGSGVVAQYAAVEYREWERAQQRARQEFARAQEALTEAQQRFGAATATWRSDPERYRGGHFDRVDFGEAGRRAEAALQQGRRIAAIAEARQEEERIRREFERQQAEAQAALIQAHAARREFHTLPHAALAPGVADVLDRQVAQAAQQVQQGDYASASQTARQVRERYEDQARKVQAAFAAWQMRAEAARAAVEDTRQAMAAIDQTFVQTWARGRLDAPQAQLRAIEQDLAGAQEPVLDTAVYDRIVAQCGVVRAAIDSAQKEADERYAEELRRNTIVYAIVDVLEGMHFNVGADLADEANPFGDVLISAGHPSGQEISMRVDIDRKVNMNLEDGVKGADCVADVYRLIEGLQGAGVELNMTDWGTADPDRVKRGGTYFNVGRPAGASQAARPGTAS